MKHSTDTRDDENMAAIAPDFARKLYSMLSDQRLSQICRWGPGGDNFVVLDQSRFQDMVLPSLFKHSNFQSFIRQLNKYGFHKIKNAGDVGNAWTFQHEHFKMNDISGLHNVKRRIPRPCQPVAASSGSPTESTPEAQVTPEALAAIQSQIDHLAHENKALNRRLADVNADYRNVLSQLDEFRRTIAAQDALIQDLGRRLRPSLTDNTYVTNPLPPAHRDDKNGMACLPAGAHPAEEAEAPPDAAHGQGGPSKFATPYQVGPASQPSLAGAPSADLPVVAERDRRTPMIVVPGWSVAPRVLIVEDNPIVRRAADAYLRGLGCQAAFAEDGQTAVNMMVAEKFDLIFMDIQMPVLDGVSATSIIRQFNGTTPIISMTGNASPTDCQHYFNHGMNGHLAKPFTKDSVLAILETHLAHLKAQLAKALPNVPGASWGHPPPIVVPSPSMSLAVPSTPIVPSQAPPHSIEAFSYPPHTHVINPQTIFNPDPFVVVSPAYNGSFSTTLGAAMSGFTNHRRPFAQLTELDEGGGDPTAEQAAKRRRIEAAG